MGKNRKNLANKPKMCYHQLRKGGSSMLIEFRVANFKSFKDEIVFSMVADSNKELSETNLFQAGNMILLRSAAVFGANASGKTNLIEAFDFFYRLFVPVIDTDEIFSNLPYFRLDEESEKKPVVFEISFFLGSERHRYGIEIDKDGIRAEWLYFVPKRQEACFYEREGDKIVRVGTYFDDKKALEYIKPDAKRPFLFTLAQDSVKNFVWAKNIFKYLSFYIRSSKVPVAFFKDMMEKELRKKSDKTIFTKDEIVSFLKKADMGITDISIEERKEEDEFSKSFAEFLKQKGIDFEMVKYETYFHHPKYDKHNNKVGDERFPLDMESAGTAKFYAMLYPILHVLKNGGVLLVDELESSLHVRLCQALIRLFNNKETNPKNAQLIFTTHSTELMHSKLLRRDQIYFIEKNKYGVSNIFSLFDIDLDIRSNFNYANNYLAGRFGATPNLKEFTIT